MLEKIGISKMTGKLEGFRAINFNPLTSVFCTSMQSKEGSVCKHCYSRAMLSTFRKSCGPKFTRNAEIMSKPMEMEQFVGFDPGESVRLLAHGDMDNYQQMKNFDRLAWHNPSVMFTMLTKRMDLVHIARNRILVCNMKIIQSSVHINKADEKGYGADAVFTVYDDESLIPADSFRCNGKKCKECMFCYTKPTGHIAELLRK